jgi:RimJ/RimL family protein N-acetyltransferase
MVLLTTKRLTLTPINQDDMVDLRALWQDEAFTRFITGRALTEEEVWLRCLRDIGQWQALGHGNWAIRETATGDYVGTVGILDYRRDITPAINAPELGWGLSPKFQGQGMATEAVQAALNWADQNLNAPRTLCMISTDNLASVRLAQRLGYRTWTTTRYKDSEVVLYERSRCSQD